MQHHALKPVSALSRLFTRPAAGETVPDRSRYSPLARISPSILLLAMLAALAAIYLAWPTWRATFPLEIDHNEAWNAYFADAARSGGILYGRELINNDYPPLSYYVVGFLSALTFDAVYVGRLLSLIATASTAMGIGLCIRQLGGTRFGATTGALWFLATMPRFFELYVGMNDPHIVALAIMTLALAWLLHSMARGRAVEPAIICMVVAGFYKHTLLSFPVTAIVWLALHDRRRAFRAALVGAAAVAIGFLLCWMLLGASFFHDLFTTRPTSVVRALAAPGRLQWIAPALLIGCLWAWCQRDLAAARFAALFMAAAFVSFLLQKLGDGVDDNAQFELAVAASIGLGCAIDNLVVDWGAPGVRIARTRTIILVVLLARLLLSTRTAPYLVLVSPDFRASLRDNIAVSKAEIARVAAIPGPAVCNNIMSVCRWAGKPFVYDHFTAFRHIAAGRMTEAEVEDRLRAMGAQIVVVDGRAAMPTFR